MKQHPRELLGPYADGELNAADTAAVASHLTQCTECAREVALIRSMGGVMRQLVNDAPPRGMWDRVHRRITTPLAWILIGAGVLGWASLIVVQWYRSRELTVEWLTFSAVAIGAVLLAVGIGYDQYREWKETRYKDVIR